MIEAVGGRKLSPELVNHVQRLWPTLVAIAADHIGDEKLPSRKKGSLHLVKEALQVDDVMQELISNDGVVFGAGVPTVQVGGNEVAREGREAAALAQKRSSCLANMPAGLLKPKDCSLGRR